MIRRPLWLLTGVALGAGGTLWAQQRVRRIVDGAQARLSPDHVVRSAARGAQQLPARVRAAHRVASEERRREERALRARWEPAARLQATPQGDPWGHGSRHAAGSAAADAG